MARVLPAVVSDNPGAGLPAWEDRVSPSLAEESFGLSGNNLHRDEAAERARLIEVETTSVYLDLASVFDGDTFRSTSEVRFRCHQPGAATFVNLSAPSVAEVVLNGIALDLADVFDGHRIQVSSLAADNVLRVVANCAYMRTGEGLHRFVDPADDEIYLYTQFETFDAHRAYACFDQPDLKTVFQLTVNAPARWQVISNMAPVPAADKAAAPDPPDGKPTGLRCWRFADTPRMSTYVTAVVAGPYVGVHDSYPGRGGEIPLGLYCRRSLAEYLDADEMFRVTKAGFGFFEESFQYPYAFGKYDQLFVPEFNAGAMENAGCVTFSDDYIFRARETRSLYEQRAEIVLHEMAHMWFGDLVTMRWWDDLWLNESFASFMAVFAQAEATHYPNAWTTFCNLEKTWAYRQDQLPSTHPIAADIVDNEAVKVNFDGITYAKGASVLKQLLAWVGREEFLAAMRGYFQQHAYGNTTLADLLGALTEASGRDLSRWSTEWLQTAGVNTLRATFEVAPDGSYRTFAIVQDAPAEHPTLRSHRLAIGLYDRADAGLARRQRVELDVIGARTEVPELVGQRQPDLLLVNDDDLTYAKIRLDERSLVTAREGIGSLPTSLSRALCWAAAWDMTRDAEMAARDYVALVLGGVDTESDVGVIQTLLRQAKLAVDSFTNPPWRPTGLAAIADASRQRLLAAEPGSDLQLVWMRAFTSSAARPEEVSLLRGVLSGERTIPGLTVDTELRWTLLTRLVVLGQVKETVIEAERVRDNTAAGARRAATALAARPDPAAKAAAWHALVETDSLPNALQTATILGFQQPDQRELVSAYADPYFAMVGRIWAERTLDMAQTLVEGLYPFLVISPDTVAKTDAFLAREQHPAALRRLLLEARAGVTRALAAQNRDRQAAAATTA
jgi:aminopeptidase N